MNVYELTHIFFRYEEETVSCPKKLGMFDSAENAKEAIRFFKSQPGFCDNKEAFSIRCRPVFGTVENLTVYEALVYYHTEDYEFEHGVELGLFGDRAAAEEAVSAYCEDNASLINARGIEAEKIVNARAIGKKEWVEGFDIYTY